MFSSKNRKGEGQWVQKLYKVVKVRVPLNNAQKNAELISSNIILKFYDHTPKQKTMHATKCVYKLPLFYHKYICIKRKRHLELTRYSDVEMEKGLVYMLISFKFVPVQRPSYICPQQLETLYNSKQY